MNFYDAFMSPLEKIILAKIRRNIIPLAFGNVLEIGYGTGVNFQYYNRSSVKNLSALDMHPASSVKTKATLPVKFFEGQAENLPFAKESFDTVVETLVFCSVESLNTAISEIRRVLKPGGIFIFMDHVMPEKKGLAFLFNITNTVWPKIAGGCSLTREPHKAIEAAGFFIEQAGGSGHDVFRWGIAKL